MFSIDRPIVLLTLVLVTLCGEVKISWTHNGKCVVVSGDGGRPVGDRSLVYDVPVVETVPMSRIVPGNNKPVSYGHYVDKKSFTWRAVKKRTGSRFGQCDSYAEAEFDVVQFDSHFDAKGIRKMRIRVRDMCTDSTCRDKRANVDCLKGPAGQMVQYNGKWINPCFEITS